MCLLFSRDLNSFSGWKDTLRTKTASILFVREWKDHPDLCSYHFINRNNNSKKNWYQINNEKHEPCQQKNQPLTQSQYSYG